MSEPKPKTEPEQSYYTQLVLKRDKAAIRRYNKWCEQHRKELRRLEREASGESVPGDCDGGYDD